MPPALGCPILYTIANTLGMTNHCSRFYPFLSHETNSDTEKGIGVMPLWREVALRSLQSRNATGEAMAFRLLIVL